jgi:hypothetical protein
MNSPLGLRTSGEEGVFEGDMRTVSSAFIAESTPFFLKNRRLSARVCPPNAMRLTRGGALSGFYLRRVSGRRRVQPLVCRLTA